MFQLWDIQTCLKIARSAAVALDQTSCVTLLKIIGNYVQLTFCLKLSEIARLFLLLLRVQTTVHVSLVLQAKTWKAIDVKLQAAKASL